MSAARPTDRAAFLLADPFEDRVLLARLGEAAAPPSAAPVQGDGAAPTRPFRPISKQALGATPGRTAEFMDAGLRALFETLGVLVAEPCTPGVHASGLWGRLGRHGLAPARGAVTYLGRALSPADAPRRAHTRVFAAPLAAVCNGVTREVEPGSALWLKSAAAETALDDPALAPFAAHAVPALKARKRPLLVSFRAGRRSVRAL